MTSPPTTLLLLPWLLLALQLLIYPPPIALDHTSDDHCLPITTCRIDVLVVAAKCPNGLMVNPSVFLVLLIMTTDLPPDGLEIIPLVQRLSWCHDELHNYACGEW